MKINVRKKKKKDPFADPFQAMPEEENKKEIDENNEKESHKEEENDENSIKMKKNASPKERIMKGEAINFEKEEVINGIQENSKDLNHNES